MQQVSGGFSWRDACEKIYYRRIFADGQSFVHQFGTNRFDYSAKSEDPLEDPFKNSQKDLFNNVSSEGSFQ
jgi:hypothetical protein